MNHIENFIRNGDVSLHVISGIASSALPYPLLIIPGAINSADEVSDSIGDYLAQDVAVMSIRGRGKSDSPETGYSLDDQASDICAVVREMFPQGCVLFGHSIGGTIAIRAAAAIKELVHAIILGDFPPFYPPLDKSWADHIRRIPERQITDTALDGLAHDSSYTDVFDELLALNCPMLIIQATKEGAGIREQDAEALAQFLPISTIWQAENTGHELFHENPEYIMQKIFAFIQGIGK